MTIIITFIVLSYAASVIINIVQKKDYVLDQKSGEIRTSQYQVGDINWTAGTIGEIWNFNNCSRNLSECKSFTRKEYADIFINELLIILYIPSTSKLNCSDYSANLKFSILEKEFWSGNFKD
jgi:hypothetical protein